MKKVLELDSLPCDTLNVALHLAASLILVSQDLLEWGDWTVDVVRVVSERGTEERAEEEVEVVIGFFQEISQKLSGSFQVCNTVHFSILIKDHGHSSEGSMQSSYADTIVSRCGLNEIDKNSFIAVFREIRHWW